MSSGPGSDKGVEYPEEGRDEGTDDGTDGAPREEDEQDAVTRETRGESEDT